MLQDPDTFEAARAELAYAYEHVPFYRAHLESGGLRPHQIHGPADWRRVRPTEKADYRRHFPAGVLARDVTLGQLGLLQTQSSGTTGERLTSIIGLETSRRRLENCFAINAGFPVGLMWEYRKRICLYIPPNCAQVECANPNLNMQARLSSLAPGAKPRLTLPVLHDVLTTPEAMTARAARELTEYRPHLLIADPNYLSFLTRYMRRAGMGAPRIEGILSGYSRATAVARRQIAAFFGPSTSFAETIGMTEFSLAVAMECRRQRLHLDTASYYAELLVDGRPAERGEIGELYLTSLGDRISPHIRYRTGDFYRRPETECDCGTRCPALVFEGRRANLLDIFGTVVMTPPDLDDIVGAADWVDVYQLVQTGPAACLFRFIANERDDVRRRDELRSRIQARLGPRVDLDVQRTNYIACERSGKYHPIVATNGGHA